MNSSGMHTERPETQRIVITGIGLAAPNGNDLASYRERLLQGQSGVQEYEIRYVGKTLAGICDFDDARYQSAREKRRGTRAGSLSIYCCQEAIKDSGLDLENIARSRCGIYLGITILFI